MMPDIKETVRGYAGVLRMLLLGVALLLASGCVSVAPPRVFISSFEYVPQVRTYQDPDINLSQFHRFAFDYTNQENPLLEKELFKMLAEALSRKGMIRDEDNPDILITMNFYVGRKESYVPPKTITTTRIEHVWSTGMFGMTLTGQATPVPIMESQTTPGYTEVSYYKNIRLAFLDYAKLKSMEKPKTPPLLWMGEAEETGKDPDIRTVAASMLGGMLFDGCARIICGSIEMEGYWRGKHLVVQTIKTSRLPTDQPVNIRAGDIVRTIHGVAPAEYNRYSKALPTSIGGPAGYLSGGILRWDFNIVGKAVELEIESKETGTVRKILVQ